MNPALNEINDMYLPIQQYVVPLPEDFEQMQRLDPVEGGRMAEEASAIYRTGLDQFRVVFATLSVEEIIEGYLQGCRLLQSHLCGEMSTHFNRAYIPVMLQAIKSSHPYTSIVFLQALADHLGDQAALIVIEALGSHLPGLRERAVLLTEQLHLLEARAQLQRMSNDSDEDIAFLARQVLRNLEGGRR